jgi:hypothetical protein
MNQPTILVTGATGHIGRPRIRPGKDHRAPGHHLRQWAAQHADAYR